MLRPVLLLAFCLLTSAVQAADGKILKVLPHLLDEEGRHSLSPSLFERDAYQAVLRKNPSRISGLRYDIQWKAHIADASRLKLRIQLRTANRPLTNPLVLEMPVKARFFHGGWTGLTLDGKSYKEAGEVQAWRATLLDGDVEIGESKSFLW
ncbi:MAG TPA: hypothetical protein VMB21_04080 [Candidatus Limnocylindria bacterium]|nr:hypothetical protein [Candidatus Limnocylindria bacterium]